ncbi:VOC family protein [Kineosporia babensis]|uniref:VOC family protein n=1 Tax=Kineosporia babensis TaxID=499548 RepID=A0A9X1NL38_9ACTN|nr:VOC family protein [Kineosporia babensis]MCD5315706.1 VOC family protein [Kineosporia babensis]
MTFALDVLDLAVPEVATAENFYKATFAPQATEQGESVDLDLHGTAQVGLHQSDALAATVGTPATTDGFRGFVISYVLKQPTEVQTLVEAARQQGATVLKPPKKSLFAGFSAVYRTPDGSIWKLAAPHRKDDGPAQNPPVPTEVGALLGVQDTKASKAFYEALGMKVDRDYGDKYIDFHVEEGRCRLALMPRKTLAKDAGVEESGSGFHHSVFTYRADSREEADLLLSAAASSGGKVAVPAAEDENGTYRGAFSDPDGNLWNVTVK